MLRSVSGARIQATWKCLAPCVFSRRQFHNTTIAQDEEKSLYSQLLEEINDTSRRTSRSPRGQKIKAIEPALDQDSSKRAVPKRSRKPKASAGAKTNVAQADQSVATKEAKTQKLPLSLLEDPWQDVVKYLKTSYRSSLGDNKRAHVISQSLCDDALQRLGPSLEQHVGCDILDINPGTCLWSKTVHERLKPRRHILVEPDEKLYRPFLLPLLNTPDSKYKLVPKSGIVWAHLQTVLSQQHLPDQPRIPRGDSRLEEKNNTLLVLVNLGFWPMKQYRGFDSMAGLVLYQFMSACRTRSLFQRYGRVRFLVWTNDEERRQILPRDVYLRRKASTEMEIAFEELNEVASTTVQTGANQRGPDYDKKQGKAVLDRMQKAGITTPPGRESVLMQKLLGKLPESDGKGPWSISKKRVEAIEAMEKAVESGKIKKYVPSGEKFTPEYRKLRTMLILREHSERRDQRVRDALDKYIQLMEMHKDVVSRRKAGEDATNLQEQLEKQKEQWAVDFELLTEDMQTRALYMLDNYRAIACDPPLLFYDRRSYEPLLVKPEEFYPPHPMCLLDFQPAVNWPTLRDNYKDGSNRDILEYVVGTFFHLPTQSVKKALKSLWPGAYEWIVERCPSLTDPHRGGALDLDSLSVRTISKEMIEEIVTAWSTWPFRPSKHEVISKMGGAGFDPDSDPT